MPDVVRREVRDALLALPISTYAEFTGKCDEKVEEARAHLLAALDALGISEGAR